MIENLTTKKLITYKEKYLTSTLSQMRGILLRKKIKKPYVFVFNKARKENTIHTFFLHYPIIILWINDLHVITKKVLAKPFRIYTCQQKTKTIIELPTKYERHFSVGDYIKVIKND